MVAIISQEDTTAIKGQMALLIVDDREDNLFVLKSLVKEHFPDIKLFTAKGAVEAQQVIAEKKVDAALIDVQLPEIDGIELCRKLKTDLNTHHLSIVLLTSHKTTPELRAKGLEAGADDFIHRPFDNLEFIARIKVMLRIKQAEDNLRHINRHLEDIVTEKLEALKESEERFRKMFRNHDAVMILIDPHTGAIVDANIAACNFYGYPLDKITGMSIDQINSLSPDAVTLICDSIVKREKGHFEFKHRLASGTLKDVEVHTSPIEIDGQNIIFSIVHDVTQRKLAEEAQTKLNHEIELKNQELEQVVYVASHDLRSPLVSIEGFSGTLETCLEDILQILESASLAPDLAAKLAPLYTESRKAIEFISKGVSSMDVLLGGLLQFSRLGKVELEQEELDMAELLTEIGDTFKFQLEKSGAVLDVATLPACVGDRGQVHHLFSNLISNALKYSDPERPGNIKVSGQREGSYVTYTVEDNGIGIDSSYTKKIFEIFHQLDPRVGGEGLGLSIVKKIVERHDGRIWVESRSGEGSQFHVSLKTKDQPADKAGHKRPQKSAQGDTAVASES